MNETMEKLSQEELEVLKRLENNDTMGYRMEVDTETGANRHKGNGQVRFWTEWE